jgi:hypothetical protein
MFGQYLHPPSERKIDGCSGCLLFLLLGMPAGLLIGLIVHFVTPDPPKCSLTLAQAPELRGLRLGMNISEVKAKLPAISKDIDSKQEDKYGYFEVGYSPGSTWQLGKGRNYGLQEVENVYLEFLDGRLTCIAISYAQSRWENKDGVPDAGQYSSYVSKLLKLPNAWEGDWNRRILRCEGFELIAYIDLLIFHPSLPTLVLKESAAEQIIQTRISNEKEKEKKVREAQEEERRKMIRP